jgi:hypothetical protein
MAKKLGHIKHEVMEMRFHGPALNVTYIEKTISGNAWACEDCGLIWEKRWYADSCTKRGHALAFEQTYGGYLEFGVHKGGARYTRYSQGRIEKSKKGGK